MKTTYFNLRRISIMISLVLAITPVSNLFAGALTWTNADNAVNNPDSALVFEAAGLTSDKVNALEKIFNDGMSGLSSDLSNEGFEALSNLTSSQMDVLFENYINAANKAKSAAAESTQSAANQTLVSDAMSDAALLMSAMFATLTGSAMDNLDEGEVDPITGKSFYSEDANEPVNAYVANLFVEIFSDLHTDYNNMGTAISNQRSATRENQQNQNNINSAAGSLKPPVSSSTFQQIMNKFCADKSGVQAKITCATSWYNGQLAYLASASKAAGKVNTAVQNANGAISAAQTQYVDAMNTATTTTDITSAYNTGVAKINSIWPALVGPTGSIAVNENDADNDLKEVDSTFFETQIDAVQKTLAGYMTTANEDYPQTLTLANVSSSDNADTAPGKALAALKTAESTNTARVSAANKPKKTGKTSGGLSGGAIAGIVTVAVVLGLPLLVAVGLFAKNAVSDWDSNEGFGDNMLQAFQDTVDQIDIAVSSTGANAKDAVSKFIDKVKGGESISDAAESVGVDSNTASQLGDTFNKAVVENTGQAIEQATGGAVTQQDVETVLGDDVTVESVTNVNTALGEAMQSTGLGGKDMIELTSQAGGDASKAADTYNDLVTDGIVQRGNMPTDEEFGDQLKASSSGSDNNTGTDSNDNNDGGLDTKTTTTTTNNENRGSLSNQQSGENDTSKVGKTTSESGDVGSKTSTTVSGEENQSSKDADKTGGDDNNDDNSGDDDGDDAGVDA